MDIMPCKRSPWRMLRLIVLLANNVLLAFNCRVILLFYSFATLEICIHICGFPLHLTGSDYFEGFFFPPPPKIGGMNCLIQLTFLKIHDIEYVENGLKFNKKNHNKMKTIGPNYILLEIVKPLVILVSMATLEHVPRLC